MIRMLERQPPVLIRQGGSKSDHGDGISLAPNGNVWIAGSTWSTDFPNAKQSYDSRGKATYLSRDFGQVLRLFPRVHLKGRTDNSRSVPDMSSLRVAWRHRIG